MDTSSDFGTSMVVSLQRRLGKAIVCGEFDAKPFPNEAELSSLFGTSRPVTREAVKMLTAKGLIDSRPKKGTFVRPVGDWNLLDPDVLDWLMERPDPQRVYLHLNDVRLAFEPIAAGLAAQCPDRALVDAIGAEVRNMYAASAPEAVLRADIAFHIAVLEASGNPFFWRLKNIIHHALSLVIKVSNSMSEVDVAKHEDVYLAIERGDVAGAEQAMRTVLATLPRSFAQKAH